MSALRKYAVINPVSGKFDRRIFGDQPVYDEEAEKIFGHGRQSGCFQTEA
jgi:hypothetical protein